MTDAFNPQQRRLAQAQRFLNDIAADPGMRAQVIADIEKRLERLAAELRMWKLTEAERAELLAAIARAIEGPPRRR
jgi:hypothetical protein